MSSQGATSASPNVPAIISNPAGDPSRPVNDSRTLAYNVRLFNAIAPNISYLVWRKALAKLGSKGGANSINLWNSQVRKNPKKTALVFTGTGQEFTFEELNAEVNRLAKYFLSLGVRPRDSVAMILENSPEFIITWFALLKIGAAAAFINTGLRNAGLHHVLKISKARILVFHAQSATQEFLASLESMPELGGWRLLSFGGPVKSSLSVLPVDTSHFSATEPPAIFRDAVGIDDTAMLIYTSGTTGLPKAAIIVHSRLMFAMSMFSGFAATTANDRMYTPLPLYHSSAAMIGLSGTFVHGATLILAPKFSASKFIPECRQHGATIAQYIGETCRFLLSTPPSPGDRDHKLHTLLGNGLRPDIWLKVKERFGIRTICEFYASTEGNAGLFNAQTDNSQGVGSIGHMGPLFRAVSDFQIVRVDPVTEEPLRDAKGHLIRCELGEPGELVAKIKDGMPTTEFKGYQGNPEGTKKKIVESAFVPGDRWFRTGDILYRDAQHNFYFKDRVGDTFRWKGENVSTTEVAESLSAYPGVAQVNVFGVEVPGADGRAGMAALVLSTTDDAPVFDVRGLAQYAKERLPAYAVPLFIRIMPEMQMTGTHKQVKYDLRNQGCNPSKVKDPLFWLAPGATEYTPFTAEDYNKLGAGRARL
ncbi:fatty acid transport protein [Entophlyctis helioformis]|nr:fatty acid transport protein [Entophlyctis helioformis]